MHLAEIVSGRTAQPDDVTVEGKVFLADGFRIGVVTPDRSLDAERFNTPVATAVTDAARFARPPELAGRLARQA